MTEHHNEVDYDIGDLIRAACLGPLDALARADTIPDGAAIEEQVRPANSQELAEIEELASQAAQIQDFIKSTIGSKSQELRKLKAQLKERLLKHGMSEVNIDGRPPIELTTSSSRKGTRKSIITVLQKEFGDKDGKMKALNLWNKIDPTTSHSISIPDPSPPEIESPY
jgi:hypothetical protein